MFSPGFSGDSAVPSKARRAVQQACRAFRAGILGVSDTRRMLEEPRLALERAASSSSRRRGTDPSRRARPSGNPADRRGSSTRFEAEIRPKRHARASARESRTPPKCPFEAQKRPIRSVEPVRTGLLDAARAACAGAGTRRCALVAGVRATRRANDLARRAARARPQAPPLRPRAPEPRARRSVRNRRKSVGERHSRPA